MADIISGAKNLLLKAKTGASTYQSYYVKSSIYTVDGLLGDDDKLKSTLMPSWVTGGMKFVEVLTNDTTLDTLYSKIVNWLEDRELPTSSPYTEFQGKYFIVAPMNPTINLTIPEGPTNLGILYGDDAYGGNQGESGGPGTPLVLERGDWIMYSHYADGTHMFAVINNTYRDARENEAGVIPLATEAEALAGTNDTKAMTPKKVKAFVDSTPLNASNLSGTIDDARLSSNVPLKHTENIFTAKNAFDDLVVRNDGLGLNANIQVNTSATEDITVYLPASGGTLALESQIDDLSVNQVQSPNRVYAGPGSGASNYPSFRLLVENDIPLLSMSKISGLSTALNGKANVVHTHNFEDVIDASSGGKSLKTTLTEIITDIGTKVPVTRTINGKPLNANITLSKSDVGLGSVQNYGIASQDDAQKDASTTSNKYMTPQRTLEAIDYWAKIPVYASEGEIPTDLPVGKLVFVEV